MVNSAVGGSLVRVASTPGSITTENSTVRVTPGSVVAVRPGRSPAGTGAAESASTAPTLPVPKASARSRSVTPSGRSQAGLPVDFSLHRLTSHEPSLSAVVTGVVCWVPELSVPPTADADTSAGPVLR